MNEYADAFLELVKVATGPALCWAFGIKAFRFVVGAFTGKDVWL